MATERKPYRYWKSLENRIKEAKALVEKLGKKPEEITADDFKDNGLCALLTKRSVYDILKDANLISCEPWELRTVPTNYWKNEENRKRATKWLVEKLGKAPEKITQNDFNDNGLCGMLGYYYNGVPYAALKDASLVGEPWEMANVTHNYWNKKPNIKKAIKWLAKKTSKRYKNLVVDDFKEHGLGGIVSRYSVHDALKQAGVANFEIWEMKTTVPDDYWKIKENRVYAAKWIVAKTGKTNPNRNDFSKYHLTTLLFACGSCYNLLKEAGVIDCEPWEFGHVTGGYWEEKSNRARAINWLVGKSGREPQEIRPRDFKRHGLGRILQHYYNFSVSAALQDAGYDIKSKQEQKREDKTAELLRLYIKK